MYSESSCERLGCTDAKDRININVFPHRGRRGVDISIVFEKERLVFRPGFDCYGHFDEQSCYRQKQRRGTCSHIRGKAGLESAQAAQARDRKLV